MYLNYLLSHAHAHSLASRFALLCFCDHTFLVLSSNSALAAEKRRRRRESHNIVERRRRDTINENITELSNLIPMCILDPRGSAEDARTIPLGLLSEKLGVDMGVLLGAGSDEDEKPLVSATATGKTKKGTTRKPKTARVSASGANALGKLTSSL